MFNVKRSFLFYKMKRRRHPKPDDELLEFLSHYDRITAKLACQQTEHEEEPPRMAVWVRENSEWTKLSALKVERLWEANSAQGSRSFCKFVSRDLLKASAWQYENIRTTFNDRHSKSLTGIYRAHDSTVEPYAIVIELPRTLFSKSDVLLGRAAALTAVVGGVGLSKAKELTTENVKLNDGIASLRTELSNAQMLNNEKESLNTELTAHNTKLNDDIVSLRAELFTAQELNAELNNQKDRLNANLNNQNECLKA